MCAGRMKVVFLILQSWGFLCKCFEVLVCLFRKSLYFLSRLLTVVGRHLISFIIFLLSLSTQTHIGTFPIIREANILLQCCGVVSNVHNLACYWICCLLDEANQSETNFNALLLWLLITPVFTEKNQPKVSSGQTQQRIYIEGH